jgi:putative colanic acid biosysnthesis UDP-glucose lipid carrier transferase
MPPESIAIDYPSRHASSRALSKRMLADVAILIDISFAIASAFLIKFAYVGFSGFGQNDDVLAGRLSYLSVIVLVISSLFFALQKREHYNYDKMDWSFWRELTRLVVAVMFSFGFALYVVFLMKESSQFSRVWMFTWCAAVFLFLLAGRVFWLAQFERLSRRGYFRRRVLLLGAGDALQRAKDGLLSDHSHVELAAISDLGASNSPENSSSHALPAAINHAVYKGQSGAIDEIIIALPPAEGALLEHVIRRLRLLPVTLNVALDFGGYKCRALDLSQIGCTNLVSVQKKPISEWNVILKACEDYFLALLALIVFSPAMAVIAVLIKLDSKGPVLFRQRRHGFNHRIFSVYKFRTMTVAEDGEEVAQATRGDKRVTRVGYFLRRTSLDELPQILNVLTGDMSLVGPRPHAITHNDYYSRMLENYACRHRVKPGITGWAQVNGLRGETTTPEVMEQRVRYDLEYIDSWSIWLDLKILFMTPVFGFVSSKAY